MDVFVEQLVKKKRDSKDYLMIVGAIVGALILIYILANVLIMVPYISFILFIALIALIYGLYVLITSKNMEYEYVFTNGMFDVDAVINARRRKKVTSLNAREIELMAPRSNSNFERYLNQAAYKKIYACVDKNADDVYFVIYNENGAGRMLLFTPNVEICEAFKKFNPRNVEIK